MMARMLLVFIVGFMVLCLQPCSAQTDLEDQDVDEHQIFYKEPIKDVKDVIYEKNGQQLNYKFDKEGKKIILENYDGESKVKVTYVNQKGKTVEKTRYSCYIHPKPPS